MQTVSEHVGLWHVILHEEIIPMKNYLAGVKDVDYWQGRQCKKASDAKTVVEQEGDPLKPALSEAAAIKMYIASCNLIHIALQTQETEESNKLVKKWFGSRTSSVDVYKKLGLILEYLCRNRLKVRFARNKSESLGAYDPDFHVPGVAQLGKPILYRRYSWGEKVMTLLHEMSHVILKTLDKGIGISAIKAGACYGPYALELSSGKAVSHNSTLKETEAINNAENWGYFLASHYTYIDEKERDDYFGYNDFRYFDDTSLKSWANFTEKSGRKKKPELPLNGYDADLFDSNITDPN